MFDVGVEFVGSSVTASVSSITRTPLHMHSGVLEVVYVMAGELHVKISSEAFHLVAGDYVVLNQLDAHMLVGSGDNVTAVIHIDLAQFLDVDPFVLDVVFACESFDLARFRKQEGLLRGLVLDLVAGCLEEQRSGHPVSSLHEQARRLMRILCYEYSLENYYNRVEQKVEGRREKFLTILRFMRENHASRNLLDLAARQLHYSKSRISHLVKSTSATSFGDLLTWVRVHESELLLLSTDDTMVVIAELCGFSDVKYFNRAFANWFQQSPAQYRRAYRGEILRDEESMLLRAAQALTALDTHRRQLQSTTGEADARLSVTPLLLKTVGSKSDLFRAVPAQVALAGRMPDFAGRTSGSDLKPHLMPLPVTAADLDGNHIIDGAASFDQINVLPCFVLEYSSDADIIELIARLAEKLGTERAARTPVWLSYSALHQRTAVDRIVMHVAAAHGIAVQPMLSL